MRESGFVHTSFVRGAALSVAVALSVLAASGAGVWAQAQDLAVSAFYGNWRGSALSESELSVYFRMTERDLDVTIGPAGEGFSISWTTVLRQKGDPNNPDVVRKSTTMTFVPAGRPGIWRETNSGDPLMGASLAWARVKGHTLTVHSMAVTDDGGFEMQVYKRTLSGLGMDLEFVRLKDGEPVRTAKGQLIKFAN